MQFIVHIKHVGSLLFQDVMHYEQLKAGVIQHDLLVDNLIYKVSSSALTLFVFMKPYNKAVRVLLKHILKALVSWVVESSTVFCFQLFTTSSIYCVCFVITGAKTNSKYFVHQDVKLTASNDDYYFVFEDFLYQVIFCFHLSLFNTPLLFFSYIALCYLTVNHG